jgi:hypothetical protein
VVVFDSAPTAKTLSVREGCEDPHFGHRIGCFAIVIDRTSFSKRLPHFEHLYS